MAFSEYPIHVDQLVVGLFVRVDDKGRKVSPVLRKGFKIKNQEQLEKLRASGLTHVTCVLNKSDRLPIPVGAEDLRKPSNAEAPRRGAPPAARGPSPPAEGSQYAMVVTREEAGERAHKTPISRELFGLKQETIERNKQRRQEFAKTEKRYDQAVADVAMMLRRVSGKSDEAVEQALAVVDRLVDTFLADTNVIVSLMTNKPSEEKQNLHAFNVAVLSMMLGRELQLKAPAMRSLGMGALFHDVGKGRVPISDMAMGKPTTMKYAVQRHYEMHPQQGARIVSDLPSFPPDAVIVVEQHHETIDGKGFPGRRKGKSIFPLARIVSVADVYDNLCNKNENDKTLTPHEALRHMFSQLRAKLDNRFLAMFIRILGVYPPGTLVQLSNGAIGMVISTNTQKSARPGVLIYHPDIPKREALVIDLLIEEELEIKKTLRPEELPREVFSYLSPSRQINYYAEALGE